MSDQSIVHPRHPSVSVEDLIERLHADGWTDVTISSYPAVDGSWEARSQRPVPDGQRPPAEIRDGGGPRVTLTMVHGLAVHVVVNARSLGEAVRGLAVECARIDAESVAVEVAS